MLQSHFYFYFLKYLSAQQLAKDIPALKYTWDTAFCLMIVGLQSSGPKIDNLQVFSDTCQASVYWFGNRELFGEGSSFRNWLCWVGFPKNLSTAFGIKTKRDFSFWLTLLFWPCSDLAMTLLFSPLSDITMTLLWDWCTCISKCVYDEETSYNIYYILIIFPFLNEAGCTKSECEWKQKEGETDVGMMIPDIHYCKIRW